MSVFFTEVTFQDVLEILRSTLKQEVMRDQCILNESSLRWLNAEMRIPTEVYSIVLKST